MKHMIFFLLVIIGFGGMAQPAKGNFRGGVLVSTATGISQALASTVIGSYLKNKDMCIEQKFLAKLAIAIGIGMIGTNLSLSVASEAGEGKREKMRNLFVGIQLISALAAFTIIDLYQG